MTSTAGKLLPKVFHCIRKLYLKKISKISKNLYIIYLVDKLDLIVEEQKNIKTELLLMKKDMKFLRNKMRFFQNKNFHALKRLDQIQQICLDQIKQNDSRHNQQLQQCNQQVQLNSSLFLQNSTRIQQVESQISRINNPPIKPRPFGILTKNIFS